MSGPFYTYRSIHVTSKHFSFLWYLSVRRSGHLAVHLLVYNGIIDILVFDNNKTLDENEKISKIKCILSQLNFFFTVK